MNDHKFERERDRQIILSDLKARIIDLTENRFSLPDTGIYDEPVRYFKANLKWTPIIFGLLDWLEDVAGWKDAQDESYPGIQAILLFEEGIDLPTFDCEDVENCLETSTIINILIQQITNLNQQIINLNQQIEVIENEQESGNQLPPTPDMSESGNDACKAANYIANRLADKLIEYWQQASNLSLEEFVNALMSFISFGFIPSTNFWQFVYTLSNPNLANEAVAKKDRIALAFFCANLDIEEAKENINNDPILTTLEKAFWIVTIELFRQGQIDEWGLIGTLSTNTYDCTGGCPWVVVWDFAGNYVPVGDETAIYTGNKWTVSNGEFVASVGYRGIQDTWTITKDLPEQCRVISMVHRCSKNELCAADDVRSWWRGTDGLQVEQYTAQSRVLSNAPFSQNWSVNAVMSEMRFQHDHFFCSPASAFGSKSHYVRMVGRGVMPTE